MTRKEISTKISILLIGITFLIPCLVSGQAITLAVGDSTVDLRSKLQKLNATDITSGLEIIGPNGEWPLKGLDWEIDSFKIIVEVSLKDNQLISICYWKEKDFSESKGHREDTRLYVQSISFHEAHKTISVIAAVSGSH